MRFLTIALVYCLIIVSLDCAKKITVPKQYQELFQSREYQLSSNGVRSIEQTAWDLSNIRIIRDFLERTAHHENKIAIFDCDGTLINGDITDGARKGNRNIDGMLPWLIKNKKLTGIDYRINILKTYQDIYAADINRGSLIPAQLLRGLKQADVITWTTALWEREFGNLIYPESKAIIKLLVEHGFEVHIISGSPEEFVRPISRYIGVPEKNIHGVRQRVENGVLTGIILHPVTAAEGKARFITEVLHKKPLYVQGDGIINDVPMLDLAIQNDGIAVFINPKNRSIMEKAKRSGYLIQILPYMAIFRQIIGTFQTPVPDQVLQYDERTIQACL